jgi:transcriptional regulator with XRE-family HTH domain
MSRANASSLSQDLNSENGLKLKAARKRLGLSQLVFAALIPVDRAYLSELENGRQTVQEWHLDKAEKIEREHGENLAVARAPLPGRRSATLPSDMLLVVEALAAGLDADTLMRAVHRITSDDRISVSAKSLCSKLLGAKAYVAPPAKLPAEIHGLNSTLTAAQRAASKKQQALARSASPAPSPSPKAASPTSGKARPARGTAGRRTSRRSPRGQVPA